MCKQPMISHFSNRWRRRGPALGLFIGLLVVNIAKATASDEPIPVPAQLAPEVFQQSVLSDPPARRSVIVRFARPSVGPFSSFPSPADADAAETAGIHAAQDRILRATFGADFTGGLSTTGRNMKRFDFMPMLAISATPSEIAALSRNPEVLGVDADAVFVSRHGAPDMRSAAPESDVSPPALDYALPFIGMPAAYAAGATGAGYHVAVIDSGVSRTHEFLLNKVASAACYSTADAALGRYSVCPGGASSSTTIDSGDDCGISRATSYCGHGSLNAGLAAGFNTNLQAGEPAHGVARASRIISIRAYSTGSCGAYGSCMYVYLSDAMKGLERVYALRNTFNIAAVLWNPQNGIVASPSCPNSGLVELVDRLTSARIAVIAGVPDIYDAGTNQLPICLPGVIAVANSTLEDQRSEWSTWGARVDLVAPGDGAEGPFNFGGDDNYTGTSFTDPAGAIVGGAFAAIRTVRPAATVEQILSALKSTGVPITSEGVTRPRIQVDKALEALGVSTPPAPASIVAAVSPVARAVAVGTTVTVFATIINSGSATARRCSIERPDSLPAELTYRTRNITNNMLGTVGVPADIPSGGRQDFLIAMTPVSAFSQNVRLIFSCINTAPAAIVSGLNTVLLTATDGAPPADLISIAVTNTNDGIMNVPLNGTGFAALAAINIGATATIQASLDANAVGASGGVLQGNVSICQTNPGTGACLAAPTPSLSTTVNGGETVTFSAFLTSNGMPMPFDPANRRLFVHFRQAGIPVGSASVAVRTTGANASQAVAEAN